MKKLIISLLACVFLVGCGSSEKIVQLESKLKETRQELKNVTELTNKYQEQHKACELAYKPSSVPECPNGAYFDTKNKKCKCSAGKTFSTDKSHCVNVPHNAHPTPKETTPWACDEGFVSQYGLCMPKIDGLFEANKTAFITAPPTTKYYHYDVTGEDSNWNWVEGEVEVSQEGGTGTIELASGEWVDIDVEWTGHGELLGTDWDGNEYELEVE